MRKLILIMGCFGVAAAQSYQHYNLYVFYSSLINIGGMAQYEYPNAILLHKTQWSGFEGAPRINVVGISIPYNKFKSIFGMQYFQDKIGIHNYNQFELRYAYRLLASENAFIGFGTGLAVKVFKSKYSQVKTYEENDAQFSTDISSKIGVNVPFSFLIYSEKFHFGLSVPYLLVNKEEIKGNSTQIKNEFNPALLHYHFLLGFKIFGSENVEYYPSLLVKAISGAPVQFDFIIRFFYQKIIGAGLLYRTGSELGLILNYKINDYFHIAYSYGYNFSRLSEVGSNTHEVALIFSFPAQKGRLRIDLPRFF